MKEPEISVGIVNAQEIHFSLNGNFFAKGETVCGEQQVAFSEGGILWNGNLYRELTFTPQDEHASFSLYDVTIGINFHWERQETQSFMGTLKLVVDEGKITAIVCQPLYVEAQECVKTLKELFEGKTFTGSESEWFVELDAPLAYIDGEGTSDINSYDEIIKKVVEYFK